jgi:hypothetical protein
LQDIPGANDNAPLVIDLSELAIVLMSTRRRRPAWIIADGKMTILGVDFEMREGRHLSMATLGIAAGPGRATRWKRL